MIEIFSFKWGNKYGPEYVNRLYQSLKQHCQLPFNYTCITDDSRNINSEIKIIDYNTFDPFTQSKRQVFTREKLVLFNNSHAEYNAWIDLDVLIHNDITDLLTNKDNNFTMIYNHWFDIETKSMKWYGKGSSCHINSSFVQWNYDSAQWIYDYTVDNQDKVFFTYKSLDKYLFYQHFRKNNINFWDKDVIYNYNYGDNPRTFRPDGKIAIFNTSHIATNNLTSDAIELHETIDWAYDIWTSYDR